MKTFENKTVVITGGTSGIGKATALAFSEQGANVVVSGRRISEGENVVREITSAGGNALFVRTDASREDDITALIEKNRCYFRRSAHCIQQRRHRTFRTAHNRADGGALSAGL
jgi:NAD(P)-dependent dehydrogenase (short-subunit alcohol dehydrogenase family)